MVFYNNNYISPEERHKLRLLGLKGISDRRTAATEIMNRMKRDFFLWKKSGFESLQFTLHHHHKWALDFVRNLSDDEEKLSRSIDYQVSNIPQLLNKAIDLKDLLEKVTELYRTTHSQNDGEEEEEIRENPLIKFFSYRGMKFKNIQNYRHDYFDSVEQIVVFEYILFRYLYHRLAGHEDFFHSKRDFAEKIKVKPSKLDSIVEILENKGLISTCLKGTPRTRYFKVNMEVLLSEIPKMLHSYAKPHNEFDDIAPLID